MPGIGNLLERSWEIFKARFWTLAGIMALGILLRVLFVIAAVIIAVVAGFGIKDLLGQVPELLIRGWLSFFTTFIPVFLVVMAGLWIIYIWITASLISAIKEKERKIGIGETLKLGWPKAFSRLGYFTHYFSNSGWPFSFYHSRHNFYDLV